MPRIKFSPAGQNWRHFGGLLTSIFGLSLPLLRAAPERPAFRAGAATSNITPAMNVPLDGTFRATGPAQHVHDELHARCLVLDDGTERFAFVVCDSTMIASFVIERAKALIAKQSQLPPDRVLISATHSHSTPRARDIGDEPAHHAYLDFVARRIADGVQRAIHNLAPARIGWGSVAKPEYLHNRRWIVEASAARANPYGVSGETVVTNPGRGHDGLIRPSGPIDPEISVLSLRHADGRPLAVLASYGLHYVGGIPAGTVSADYFGVFCDRMRELLGTEGQEPPFVGLMANGTSGDVNMLDPRGAVRERAKPFERMTAVAHDLAAAVSQVCWEIPYRDSVSLAMRQAILPLRIRKPDAARLRWAKTLHAYGQAKAAAGQPLTRPEAYAREAMRLAEMPAVVNLPLQAIRIGDFAVTAIPTEVFAVTGLALKRESPFAMTMNIALANGYFGYLPTPQQHELGGYETWDTRSNSLEVGAEPAIREAVLALLRTLPQPANPGANGD
jgi:neutral ceramidase